MKVWPVDSALISITHPDPSPWRTPRMVFSSALKRLIESSSQPMGRVTTACTCKCSFLSPRSRENEPRLPCFSQYSKTWSSHTGRMWPPRTATVSEKSMRPYASEKSATGGAFGGRPRFFGGASSSSWIGSPLSSTTLPRRSTSSSSAECCSASLAARLRARAIVGCVRDTRLGRTRRGILKMVRNEEKGKGCQQCRIRCESSSPRIKMHIKLNFDQSKEETFVLCFGCEQLPPSVLRQ